MPGRHSWTCRLPLLLLATLSAILAADAQLSAKNAATFVLLRGIDTNEAMRRAFYDSPANTTMTVPVDAYEVLSEARNGVFVQSGYRSPLFYRGKVGAAPRPYRVRLSDEWVLLQKPLTAQRATVTYTEDDEDVLHSTEETLLLHCRLPLPWTDEEIAVAEAAFLRQEGPVMQSVLEEWWMHLGTPERGEHCLFGDGESGTTGVARYYTLCPAGRTSRVRHSVLKSILDTRARHTPRDAESSRGRTDAVGKDEEIIDFLRAKDREQALSDIADDSTFAAAFEVIGQFHPTISLPRWNAERAAWEVTYPSTSPCATHLAPGSGAASVVDGKSHTGVTGLKPFIPASWQSAPASVRQTDAYWKTLVRFRCADDGTANSDQVGAVGYWAITDMRQTCTYHMEISTHAVCGWEQELDRLRLNAIPCAVLG